MRWHKQHSPKHRGGGTSPAGLVLAGPLFSDQVMNIQKYYTRVYIYIYIYIARACEGKRSSAEVEGHTLWKAAICPPSFQGVCHSRTCALIKKHLHVRLCSSC